MMKCDRRKLSCNRHSQFPMKLVFVTCWLWIILTQTASVNSQESKVTNIDPTVSEEAAPSNEATEAETKTPAIPDSSVPVSVSDSPTTTVATTEDPTLVDLSSTTASPVQETETILPSHVEPSPTQTSLDSTAEDQSTTETVTQSATVTETPSEEAEQPGEETKQEETETDSGVVDQLLVPESFSDSAEEGNQSALPEQPSGIHGTESTPGTEEEEGPDKIPVTVATEKKPEDKPMEEGLTFGEWTQRILAEEEKDKQDAQTDSGSKAVPQPKQRKKKNYSSTECGAKVLTFNPEATNPHSVLNSNRDDYMINPCKVKKWFVIELCEPIQVQSVDIASLELFSSRPKSFKVFLSERFPTKDWKLVAELETEDERTIQMFPITQYNDYFSRFVRVELLDHYGNEHFCPITMFRVYGTEFDEESHGGDDNDDEDDDDLDDSTRDTGEDSTNLFTSAKDTVINIVKKVLNVGPDDSDLPNITENATVSMDANLPEGDVEMLPCFPNARTGEEGSSHTVTVAPDTTTTRPTTPEPGKTDDMLVTILEDDEQPETGNNPFDTLLEEKNKMRTYRDYKNTCFLSDYSGGWGTQKTSRICYFLSLALGQCVVDLEPELKPLKPIMVDENLDQTGSTVTSTQTVQWEITEKVEQAVDQSTAMPESQVDLSQKDEVSSTMRDEGTSSVDIEPTSVLELIQQTDSPSSDEMQTDSQTATAIDKSTPTRSHVVDSVSIDPSYSQETDKREATPAISGEATPSIEKDWKPTTEDAEMSGSVVSGKDQTLNEKIQPETSLVSDGTPLTDVVQDTPIDTVTSDLPQPSEVKPVGSSTAVPSETEGGDVPGDEAEKREAAVDKQEDKANGTVVVPKVESGDKDKKKNLDLVKVPVIPVSKRESAIMRLSNRIKVLEQNVSLSSRFLEELSKRYKKQSEDMMKMLNKTLAKLNNVTTESEVKHRLHEVEMTEMEKRMKNLTDVVNHLTLNLNGLNQQVKDRQMIWTSIEIAFIIVLFVFVNQRRKKDVLTAESRKLLDKMPSEPRSGPGLPHRRNSISGPATPSKQKPDLPGGSPLQRFSSETALDQDFPIIAPLRPIDHQVTDGVKKKRKKKQKQQECRAQSVIPPVGWEPKLQPVTSHSTSHGEKEAGSKSTSFSGLNFPGLSFFSSGKSGSYTGQQVGGLKARVSQSEGRNTVNGESAASKPLTNVVGVETISSNRNGVGGETSKKVPLSVERNKKADLKKARSQDLSGSDKSGPRISPNTSRKVENVHVKGHRRQRSLPKQHYSLPETREVESSQYRRKSDYVENGGHDVHVQDLCLKTGGMKKSTSVPTSSKQPPVTARRSMDSMMKPGASERSAFDSESAYRVSESKSSKNLQNRYTDHTHGNLPLGAHRSVLYSNGWDPGETNDDHFFDAKSSHVDCEERFGKLKACPDLGTASSMDTKPSVSASFCDTACNGAFNLQSNANGIASMNGGTNEYSEIGPNHVYYGSDRAECGFGNSSEHDELSEKQPGNWKKMFGLFR